MKKRRLTITVDFDHGEQPYVLSLLPQVQTIVVEVLSRRDETNGSRVLDTLGLHIEVRDEPR